MSLLTGPAIIGLCCIHCAALKEASWQHFNFVCFGSDVSSANQYRTHFFIIYDNKTAPNIPLHVLR
jgi:hypothetical protein